MRALTAVTALVALSLAACGGPLFSAEVEVERFCFSQQVTGIPFSPAAVPSSPPLTVGPVSVPVKLPPLLTDKGSVTIRLEDATLVATTAGVDLSGIQTLQVEEQVTGGGRVLLASYTRPSPPPLAPLGSITAAGRDVDIAAAARAGSFQVLLTAGGQPPVNAAGGTWSGQLRFCAHGKTTVGYF